MESEPSDVRLEILRNRVTPTNNWKTADLSIRRNAYLGSLMNEKGKLKGAHRVVASIRGEPVVGLGKSINRI